MSLKDKTIVATGGSRGLGLGLVEALAGQGAKVTVVARDPAALAAVEQRLGVATISADVTDKGHAQRILADVRPEILVLNAGATPRMGAARPAELGGLHCHLGDRCEGRALLAAGGAQSASQAGSRVLVGSSGAAENGSPLSGGYAGAKRMLWIMAKYANGVAKQKGLDICFQAIVPLQIGGNRGR
jgi:NAD(P)-dependent dehydrogenase (short-subunit alcohol dehydrogenase family)